MTAWDKSWMKFVDWSRMEMTFKMFSESQRKLILEKGYWSNGKGKFEVVETIIVKEG